MTKTNPPSQDFNAQTKSNQTMMKLFAIGGAINCETPQVLTRLLKEAKGAGSSVCVVTSATEDPEGARRDYETAFRALGVSNLTIIHQASKADADDPVAAEIVRTADIIFFSGGDQLQLVERLEGTRFMEAVNARFREGGIIAGTSAGAAAMSRMMIYPDGTGGVTLKNGFGFCDQLIIDTHFSERARLSRLSSLVAREPGKIGVGLDEDTAVCIANGVLEVVGKGTVTIIDGKKPPRTRIKVLKNGERYNLAKRKKSPKPQIK